MAKAEKATAIVIEENTQLRFQVEYFKRLAFGQKRERFEGDKDQMSLPFEMAPETARKQQEEVKEKLTYERRKRTSNHQRRMPLPDHLPVEEITIYPEGDLSEMVCIGEEITEELEYDWSNRGFPSWGR